ncbi:MAG TPA: hypothetical protein VFW13_13690 [Phenylobacterium sp.]|nr:hypothetical protein [Phenylobacterium sp.]
MVRVALGVLAGLMIVGAAQAADPPPGLQDENVLMPLPKGFKLGDQGRQGAMDVAEYVPSAETVNDWSQMITRQTFHGRANDDPDGLPQFMAKSWPAACPGGTAQKLAGAVENGYRTATWSFRCPTNPQTGKPETMWIKTIGGADALYSVQVAWRRAYAEDLAAQAAAYLGRVTVCDTRAPTHPCPALQPAGR